METGRQSIEESVMLAGRGSRRRNRIFGTIPLFMVSLLFAMAFLPLTSSYAAVIYVDTTNEGRSPDGNCTLAEAIQSAETNSPVDACASGVGQDLIILPHGTYNLTTPDNATNGPNGLPVIGSNITIRGDGYDKTIIQRQGGSPFRIFWAEGAGALTLIGVTIKGGQANVGGGIANIGQTLTLNQCRIMNNHAEVSGGGIYDSDGSLYMTDSIVMENDAGSIGGGVHLSSVAGDVQSFILRSELTDNIASVNGGGIYAINHPFSLTESIVSRNEAQNGEGGGLDVRFAPAYNISHSTVSKNKAGVSGGGIFLYETSLHLVNSSIFENEALLNGGGVAVWESMFLARNSTIGDNTSGGPGGGTYFMNDAGSVFQNMTIADNKALHGGGLYNAGGGAAPVIVSTILADNTATGTGLDCNGNFASLDYNLLGDATGCTIGLQANDLTGTSGLASFTDNGGPGNGHFPLNPTSQAVDAGLDSLCLPYDQIGQGRINICDMGAMEASTPTPIFGGIDNEKAKFKFYFAAGFEGSDTFSLVGYLKKQDSDVFILPFDQDVTLSVEVEDPRNAANMLPIFSQSVSAGTVPVLTDKYRLVTSYPGIREVLIQPTTRPTDIRVYLLTHKLNCLAEIKAVMSPEEYRDFLLQIDRYTLTVQIGDSEWSGSADLKKFYLDSRRVDLSLDPSQR